MPASKLLPAVPQPGAWIDVTVFLAQQLLLDIGGMALLRKAQKHSLAYYVGFLLIGQVIVSVLVAAINRVVPLGSVETIIEGVLLVAWAVLAVEVRKGKTDAQ